MQYINKSIIFTLVLNSRVLQLTYGTAIDKSFTVKICRLCHDDRINMFQSYSVCDANKYRKQNSFSIYCNIQLRVKKKKYFYFPFTVEYKLNIIFFKKVDQMVLLYNVDFATDASQNTASASFNKMLHTVLYIYDLNFCIIGRNCTLNICNMVVEKRTSLFFYSSAKNK